MILSIFPTFSVYTHAMSAQLSELSVKVMVFFVLLESGAHGGSQAAGAGLPWLRAVVIMMMTMMVVIVTGIMVMEINCDGDYDDGDRNSDKYKEDYGDNNIGDCLCSYRRGGLGVPVMVRERHCPARAMAHGKGLETKMMMVIMAWMMMMLMLALMVIMQMTMTMLTGKVATTNFAGVASVMEAHAILLSVQDDHLRQPPRKIHHVPPSFD
jgi:heme/copper-type cytochrome/quinol oxidase subunit 2